MAEYTNKQISELSMEFYNNLNNYFKPEFAELYGEHGIGSLAREIKTSVKPIVLKEGEKLEQMCIGVRLRKDPPKEMELVDTFYSQTINKELRVVYYVGPDPVLQINH